MSARQAMKHRVTIERRQEGSTDAHGHPVTTGWQPHLTAIPCYAWFGSGRVVRDSDKSNKRAGWQMMVPRDTDIDPFTDRVAVITRKDGAPVVDSPIRVESVGRRFDHMHVEMERTG